MSSLAFLPWLFDRLACLRAQFIAKEVVFIPKPEKTFRIGLCSASVFVNAAAAKEGGESRTFRTVSLQRRYRDGDDWKTSTSFTLADLPAAIAVLQLVLQHIASAETEPHA